MQRIVLALALTGAAGLLAPQCHLRAPRAVLRAEAAEAPAEATAAPTFKVIDIPSDKCTPSVPQKPGNRRQGSRAARFDFATRGAKTPNDAVDAPPAPYAGDAALHRRRDAAATPSTRAPRRRRRH